MTGGMAAPAVPLGCTGPGSYVGHERLRRDLELLRAAVGGADPDPGARRAAGRLWP